MNPDKPKILAVMGPTAVGKTEIAIGLARRWNGEIVNIDSRQVYRGLDVGTAKPTWEERALARHHLVDILEPDQWLHIADFQKMAYMVIADIFDRDKLPILAGGTGQYMQAILDGWEIPLIEPDHGLRLELESFSDVYGASQLFNHLVKINPKAGKEVDPSNVRRVARAIEVSVALHDQGDRKDVVSIPGFTPIRIGLTRARGKLYSRADLRVANMLKNNWTNETKSIISKYPFHDLPSLNSLGYPEIIRHLNGELTIDEIEMVIRKETHRYIRNQYTWFKEKDSKIKWFDLETETIEDINAFLEPILEQGEHQGRLS